MNNLQRISGRIGAKSDWRFAVIGTPKINAAYTTCLLN